MIVFTRFGVKNTKFDCRPSMTQYAELNPMEKIDAHLLQRRTAFSYVRCLGRFQVLARLPRSLPREGRGASSKCGVRSQGNGDGRFNMEAKGRHQFRRQIATTTVWVEIQSI